MLAPWKESYDKPRSVINKQRHHLPKKIHLVKAMIFSSSHVQMWELDHKKDWAPKNWYFKLWCWRNSWESLSWTARRSNQSALKEINSEYSLQEPMLKLKLQYFGYLFERVSSIEKTLMLGKIEGRRRRGWQRLRWLDGITSSMDKSLSKEIVKERVVWCATIHGLQRAGQDLVTE